MTKINHGKRNLESKVKRKNGYKVFAPKKATAKQKAFMKKLGIGFDSTVTRITASQKIDEALKAYKANDR